MLHNGIKETTEMDMSEMFHPFNLAAYNCEDLRALATELSKVPNDIIVRLRAMLEDVSGRRFTNDKRAKAWLEFYRIGGFRKNKLLLGKAAWFEPYIRLMVSRREKGWEDFQNLVPLSSKGSSIGNAGQSIAEAIINDDFLEFIMHCDLMGVGLTKSDIQELIEINDAGNIADGVIRKLPNLAMWFPRREMLLYICACCPNDDKSVRLAAAIEAVEPGLAKSVDVNGWTPLTYSLFKKRHFKNGGHAFIKSPKLEKWLIEHGCDPDRKDKYGLSWRQVRGYMPGGIGRG